MCKHPQRARGQDGYSTGVNLLAVTVSLVLVAVLVVLSTGVFSGGATAGKTSILSTSSAETQLKLCSEGRDSSTYGDPPTPAQQAKCLDQLAGQISGSGLAGGATGATGAVP